MVVLTAAEAVEMCLLIYVMSCRCFSQRCDVNETRWRKKQKNEWPNIVLIAASWLIEKQAGGI